jgi:VanZ family protein
MNYRWLAIGYISFIFLVIIAADTGQLNFFIRWIHSIPYGDKLGHFILVGMLALVINLSWNAARFRWGWGSILKGSLMVFILITLEELSQLFISYRHFDFGDLASNYLGILLLGHLAIYFAPRELNNVKL